MMVAHDINLAAQHVDPILVLCCGEVVTEGTPKMVVTPEVMKKIFAIDAHIVNHPVTQQPVLV